MRRRLVIALVVAGFCLGVVVTRAVWEGHAALSRGDEAMAAGDRDEAIRWWRRAARWYAPLSPHVGEALDRLEALGAAAEEAGDLEIALAAWRGVRSSILATRSFYTPHAERLEPVSARIAALMARIEAASEEEPRVIEPQKRSQAEIEALHRELLARDEAPSVGWTAVALLGFLLWIGGGVLFALRGVSAEDRLVARSAVTAGVAVVAGLLVWMLGLYNA